MVHIKLKIKQRHRGVWWAWGAGALVRFTRDACVGLVCTLKTEGEEGTCHMRSHGKTPRLNKPCFLRSEIVRWDRAGAGKGRGWPSGCWCSLGCFSDSAREGKLRMARCCFLRWYWKQQMELESVTFNGEDFGVDRQEKCLMICQRLCFMHAYCHSSTVVIGRGLGSVC